MNANAYLFAWMVLMTLWVGTIAHFTIKQRKLLMRLLALQEANHEITRRMINLTADAIMAGERDAEP